MSGQENYADMLMKTYEQQLFNRLCIPSVAAAPSTLLFNNIPGNQLVVPGNPCMGVRPVSYTPVALPTFGTHNPFQHILVNMASSTLIQRGKQTPGSPPTQTSGPIECGQRSTSIAALRMKAREYEFKLDPNTVGLGDGH